jgi:hypothetical protein
MEKLSKWFGTGFAFFVVGLVAYVGLSTHVWIWFDNGGNESMSVSVDGKEVALIRPGDFVQFESSPGEHNITVRCGNKVIFDGVKTLAKPEGLGGSRCYLFNPDGNNRYHLYAIQYGRDPFEDMAQLFGNKEKENLSINRQDQIRRAYKEFAKEPELMPPDTWFEFRKAHYVLVRPARSITSRNARPETRLALARVSLTDYAVIQAARENQDPTEDDLMDLVKVVERMFGTMR